MKSLIWKEARQQLPWFVLALVVATELWFLMGNVWDQLVAPPSEVGFWSLGCPLLYAFALAQLQFGRDGDTRRFGLLVHRGQGPRGYFASKLIVGVAALVCVAVLPMSFWALTRSFLDPDAELIRWVRIPQAALFCVPLLVVYAMGVFSTQLRRGVLLRWGVAIVGTFGAAVLTWPLALLIEPGPLWWIAWAGIDLLFACAVLWLARGLLLQGRDRDLPLRDKHLAGVALVAFLILLPLATFVVGTNESSALGVIVESKPAVLFDPQSKELCVATWTEDGWRELSGTRQFTKEWSELFHDQNQHELELVHHAGSTTVDWADRAGDMLAELSRRRTISDQAPRAPRNEGFVPVPAKAQGGPEPLLGERWTVHFELDAQDGAVHIDASRTADGLPPLRVAVMRPDGKFSAQACFLESPMHSPLAMDFADGTLWRIELQQDGARVLPLELPGGDRVRSLEPLFRRKEALLGRFQQQYFSSSQISSAYLYVGSKGKYTLLDGKFEPFGAESRPKDTVTREEAHALARYAVVSTWPDAFTEEIRVEQLPDHKPLLELSAGPGTTAERRCAAIYSALQFLRPLGGVLEERFAGRTTSPGWMSAPYPKERSLFAHGGHPLLFALLMLSGSFQLFLGWRWLARGGVGIPTRVVYMLLIFVGGLVALVLTRLLLPRHVRSSPRPARQSGLEPLPARG